MRIISAVTNDLSTDQRIHRVASALTEAGHTVTVVGRTTRRTQPLSKRSYHTRRMPMLLQGGKLFYLAFNFRLFWYLIFHRADVYNANDLDSLLAFYLAGKIKRVPVIYDAHEFYTELPEVVSRPRVRNTWLKLERWALPAVRKAYTVNASIAKEYENRYKIPFGVIRNLPFRRTPAPTVTRNQSLIYQGALNEGRGLELLIESMKHLPGYTLHIFGGGTIEEALLQKVRGLQLEKQVHISGYLPFEELSRHTHESCLGFSLEESRGDNYRLALPNKLFDYIQAGVPVLVADLPEMRSVIEQYGTGKILAESDRTPEKLAAVIRSLTENETEWNRYHQECLSAAAELCWENEKEKLKAIYTL